ncbi:hypothetical protein [Kitasatospora sp. NPDC101183]|uniref:hypothetical protein n=1 Tax=Kitasatospora sp. NPDC101183 TaxID=3364100 RepID=UPI00381BBBF1
MDSTAMAVMAPALVPNDPTATAAVHPGVAWITAQQKADGGFPGGAWSYSELGAAGYHPAPGDVEGWAFGAGGRPSVTAP